MYGFSHFCIYLSKTKDRTKIKKQKAVGGRRLALGGNHKSGHSTDLRVTVKQLRKPLK